MAKIPLKGLRELNANRPSTTASRTGLEKSLRNNIAAIPEQVPKEAILGLASDFNVDKLPELTEQLRRTHGVERVEPLWPVVLAQPLLRRVAPEANLPHVRQWLRNMPAGFTGGLPGSGQELGPGPLDERARRRLRLLFPDRTDLSAVLKQLEAYPGVSYVEAVPWIPPCAPDEFSEEDMAELFKPRTLPNGEPAYAVRPNDLWPLDRIGYPAADWKHLALDNIAVLDSGCDAKHPGLEGRIDGANKESLSDPCGHGTFVCGIIGGAYATTSEATQDSHSDVANGVLPGSRLWVANIMEVSHRLGGTEYFRIDPGRYSWALNQLADGATERAKSIRVVNLSIGSTTRSRTEAEDLRAVSERGILLVASSGNVAKGVDGAAEEVMYPARYPFVISVGAEVSKTREIWPRTRCQIDDSRDMPLDVTAPGEYILSALPRGANSKGRRFSGWLSGTSMAAPYVASVLAVLCHQSSRAIRSREDALQALADAAGAEISPVDTGEALSLRVKPKKR